MATIRRAAHVARIRSPVSSIGAVRLMLRGYAAVPMASGGVQPPVRRGNVTAAWSTAAFRDALGSGLGATGFCRTRRRSDRDHPARRGQRLRRATGPGRRCCRRLADRMSRRCRSSSRRHPRRLFRRRRPHATPTPSPTPSPTPTLATDACADAEPHADSPRRLRLRHRHRPPPPTPPPTPAPTNAPSPAPTPVVGLVILQPADGSTTRDDSVVIKGLPSPTRRSPTTCRIGSTSTPPPMTRATGRSPSRSARARTRSSSASVTIRRLR